MIIVIVNVMMAVLHTRNTFSSIGFPKVQHLGLQIGQRDAEPVGQLPGLNEVVPSATAALRREPDAEGEPRGSPLQVLTDQIGTAAE